MEIELSEAQAKLYELGELAWAGHEIVIKRNDKPYLLLVTHTEGSEPNSSTERDAETTREGCG